MKTLYDRLDFRAKGILENEKDKWPNTIRTLYEYLQDDTYIYWTDLPYNQVKLLHMRIYGDVFDHVDEEEIRMLFEEYYNE
jgi:hypothetical protein